MMAIDKRQLQRAEAVLDDEAVEKALKARRLSRRAHALLAAAGQSEPAVMRWYVLMIEQGADNSVDNALTNAGIDHWMPALARKSKWRGGRKWQRFCAVMKPAFPGYMFVRVVWTDEVWHGLKAIDGVADVIGGAYQPAPLQDKELAKFRARAEKDPKFIEELTNALKRGDVVRVDDGPFASFEGIVAALGRGGRVKVDVHIFGRPTTVGLDLAQITKLD